MDSLFDVAPFVLGFCLWSLLIVLSLFSLGEIKRPG